MQSKLTTIAARMRKAISAKPFGWTDTTLTGGLNLILSHNGEKWRLALRREKVFPSADQGEILCRAFGVAEGTEPQRRTFCELGCVTQRRIEWKIVEYNWIEAN